MKSLYTFSLCNTITQVLSNITDELRSNSSRQEKLVLSHSV